MSRHRVHGVAVLSAGLLLSIASNAAAVETDSLREELARIFGPEKHYEPEAFGPARWLLDGEAYTTLEPSESVPDAKDIVRYESGSGKREVLVDAKSLVPPGETKPLEIKDYAWSEDRARLLVFTNTKRVWRRDTRGDYWVFDREIRTLRKLSGLAPAATLMFAKFSPDGTRVAYVHENDIYVEAFATGAVTRLTQDGSATSIHGTSDWVYEEELDVCDGFRWSPDGRRIVYWSFDSTGVGEFTLINDTDSLYPALTRIAYPKVGTTNSAVRIGVVSSNGGETSWMKVPGDPRNTYVASVDWARDSDHVVLQHLNRLQNTNDLLRADATSGEVERLFRDQSDTWSKSSTSSRG